MFVTRWRLGALDVESRSSSRNSTDTSPWQPPSFGIRSGYGSSGLYVCTIHSPWQLQHTPCSFHSVAPSDQVFQPSSDSLVPSRLDPFLNHSRTSILFLTSLATCGRTGRSKKHNSQLKALHFEQSDIILSTRMPTLCTQYSSLRVNSYFASSAPLALGL
ncbi:unnamed protein product [Protopolystoma xenopodis]|uniref:Uncharacterized protein n=1 Tax=Protopolystoma xenopodis TaxID=117903 RepID=A0A448WNX3_9PLAT|nr:unnamed protein product [Protopolystoma xenopodis]